MPSGALRPLRAAALATGMAPSVHVLEPAQGPEQTAAATILPGGDQMFQAQPHRRYY